MKSIRILFAIALAIALFLCTLSAQAETWELVGDLSGAYDVQSLLVTSEYIYAGTDPNGDVFRSASGTSWSNTGQIGTANNVKGLAQGTDGAIYAGVGWNNEYGAVWKSTNHGTSWTQTAEPDTSNGVYAIQDLLGASGGPVFAASAMIAPLMVYATVYVTSDGGATWGYMPKCSTGIFFTLFQASDGTIYAGGRCSTSSTPMVYKSADGLSGWTANSPGYKSASVLSLTEGVDGAIYAGTSTDGEVYKSIDGGDSWTLTGEVSGYGKIQALATFPDGTIYAGRDSSAVYKTSDGGVTWQSAGAISGISEVNCLVVDGNYLYAGTSSGGRIYRTIPCDCTIGTSCYNDDDVNPANSCQFCDSSQSTTSWSNQPDGTDCDDGDFCTGEDVCQAGFCEGSTLDCDDELWCNGLETCIAGEGCVSGTPPCTLGVETCNELLNQCQSGVPDISTLPSAITETYAPNSNYYYDFYVTNTAESGAPDLEYTIDLGPEQVTDIIGNESSWIYLGDTMTVVNLYEVDQDTTLRSITLSMILTEEAEITAVVYENDDSGDMILIDEKTAVIFPDEFGTDVYTISGLRTPLVSSKYYFIGFTWQNSSISSSASYGPYSASFGTCSANMMLDYYKPLTLPGSGLNPGFTFYQKIITGNSLPWVSIYPQEGTVSPSRYNHHYLEFQPYNIVPGIYTTELLVESNDPDEPLLEVPIEITIECEACYIAGSCWQDQQLCDWNVCKICDPAQSTTSWSSNDACITVPIPISEGFNLVSRSMRLNNWRLNFASDIVDDIEAQGGSVLEIQWWDDTAGSWRTYDPSFPLDDFPVGLTTGFFVRAATSSTWEITGLMDAGANDLSVANGYTMIAVPTNDYALASDLISAMAASCDVSELIRWDASTQGWETFDPTFPLFDFPMDRTSGYFLHGGADCTFSVGP